MMMILRALLGFHLVTGIAAEKQKVLNFSELHSVVFRKKTFTSAMAILFKGELKKIQEFVAFHFIQGIQSFYIYDEAKALSKSSFGKLGNYVEIRHLPIMENYKGHQFFVHRQMFAYRDAFVNKYNKNMVMGIWDVDEYVFSNDYPRRLIPDIILESGRDESFLYCPRFGLRNMKGYNSNELIISQFTSRGPFGKEGWDGEKFPDCKLKTSEPKGLCFQSTHQKAIYSMKDLPLSATDHISIHGIVRKKFHNFTTWIATSSREANKGGLSCNHYFALDDIQTKIRNHEMYNSSDGIPTFYDVYAVSEQVQRYYSMFEDTSVKDRFAPQLQALIAEVY